MDNLIEPGFFANGLKNGGPANNYEVTAVLLRVGANFPDGFVSPARCSSPSGSVADEPPSSIDLVSAGAVPARHSRCSLF